MSKHEGISAHSALMIGVIVAATTAIYAGNWQADMLAQRQGFSICGDGVCDEDEKQVLCPACAIGPDGVPLGNCDCTMQCEADCKQEADPVCGNKIVERGEECDDGNNDLSDGCHNCKKRPVCGNGTCERGERGECFEDCSCVSVDCVAPPEGCRYVDAKFEGDCQVHCGRIECEVVCPQVVCAAPPDGCRYEEKELKSGECPRCGELICDDDDPEPFRDPCETMDCPFGCNDGKCKPDPKRCEPYDCFDAAGNRPPRCAADGTVINYFVDPCHDTKDPPPRDLKPAPPPDHRRLCGGRYRPGEWFKAEDGCNSCFCQEDGNVACTEMACIDDPPEKLCEGRYRPGETYLAPDGCNKCVCGDNGLGGCTRMACIDRPHFECESDDDCPFGKYCKDGWCTEERGGPPGDGKCMSSNECRDGDICSVELGDCMPMGMLDVCGGFCMPREFANPSQLPRCTVHADCGSGKQCTAQMHEECIEECPLDEQYCNIVCDGRCIPVDFDEHPEEDWNDHGDWQDHDDHWDDWEDHDEWGDYDHDRGMVPGDHGVEYEDEVRTVPVHDISRFSDVEVDTLEGQAANELASRSIIGGRPDGTFGGGDPVNRAEAAKFLLVSRFGGVGDHRNNGRFLDLLEGEWYVKYVIEAASLGIISGYSDRTFRPAQTVNTSEFLKMLSETYDLPLNLPHNFSDVFAGVWFEKYAGVADKYDLFPGRVAQGKLQPERLLTRGDVAIAIYRLLEKL